MADLAAPLLQCLRNITGQDDAKRRQAEAFLESQRQVPGYGVTLCRFVIAPALPLELRQLAGIVLKKLIKDEWEGAMVAEEKTELKQMLPGGLLDPERKVTTARTGQPNRCSATSHYLVGLVVALVSRVGNVSEHGS